MRQLATLATTLVLLAACAPSPIDDDGFLREVPEQILANAAPNQNLNAVKLLEEDGCFWYQYDGPVETTLLPLLSQRGRHFCIGAALGRLEARLALEALLERSPGLEVTASPKWMRSSALRALEALPVRF